MSGNTSHNFYGEITGLTLYENGTARVHRTTSALPYPHVGQPGKREKITSLSKRSLRNFLTLMNRTSIVFKSMMTLTYPAHFPSNGREVKADWNRFRTRTRRFLGFYDYVWFLEFQKRGAPHFHVLTTLEAPSTSGRSVTRGDYMLRDTFATAWCEAVRRSSDEDQWRKVYRVHSHPKQWDKIRRPDGAKRYVAKYMSKPYQKVVPEQFSDVGRFWGASHGVRENVYDVHSSGAVTEELVRELLLYLDHRAKGYAVIPKYLYGLPMGKLEALERQLEADGGKV